MRRLWRILISRIREAWLIWLIGGSTTFSVECMKCGARSREFYFEACADIWSAAHRCKGSPTGKETHES